MFADIAGFTPLISNYSQLGSQGIEQITVLLNDYFGSIINRVTEWGGDVEKIAGDALVAFWPVRESKGTELHDLSLHAVRCAIAIQNELENYRVSDELVLNMRIAIVAGDLMQLIVGGVDNRWQFLLAGDAMLDIENILHDAEPGTNCALPQALRLTRGIL